MKTKHWRKRAKKAEALVVRLTSERYAISDARDQLQDERDKLSMSDIDTTMALLEANLGADAGPSHMTMVERLIQQRDVASTSEELLAATLHDITIALDSEGIECPFPQMTANAVRGVLRERRRLSAKLVETVLKPGRLSTIGFDTMCEHLDLPKKDAQSAMVGLGWSCDESGTWHPQSPLESERQIHEDMGR